MPTRQQQRASAHANRRQRKALPPAEAMPVIVRGRAQNRRFNEACEALAADKAAAFAARRETRDEAWADYRRICEAADAEYDRASAAADAAFEQRTADSHKPGPEADEPADAAVTE